MLRDYTANVGVQARGSNTLQPQTLPCLRTPQRFWVHELLRRYFDTWSLSDSLEVFLQDTVATGQMFPVRQNITQWQVKKKNHKQNENGNPHAPLARAPPPVAAPRRRPLQVLCLAPLQASAPAAGAPWAPHAVVPPSPPWGLESREPAGRVRPRVVRGAPRRPGQLQRIGKPKQRNTPRS